LTTLALDTTSEFGSLALQREEVVLAERVLHSADGFAHVLFQAVAELLQEAGIALEAIDIFAAASGPGSFTGVRVGLAAVKGLAEAGGKRAYGISTLRALSYFGTAKTRCAVLDARRGEVFAGIYDSNLRAAAPEIVGPLPSWLAHLPVPVDEFVVFAGSPFATALQGQRYVEAPRSLAVAIAVCAARDANHGVRGDPAALDANYVRRPDAEHRIVDDGGALTGHAGSLPGKQ
jgi:tRNA threonylcarbamoyladenosine biosynthesis protein TsaB